MDVASAGRKPANENPWYVLMTLYGEQDGLYLDADLASRNRKAWNAWSCQAMNYDAQLVAARSAKVTIEEVRGWNALQATLKQLHEDEMRRRNVSGFEYPGMPNVASEVNLDHLLFEHVLVMNNAVFSGSTNCCNAFFNREAWFCETNFIEKANFDSSTFRGKAYFSAVFNGSVSFDSAVFSRAAMFASATLSGPAVFDDAKFSDEACFASVAFGSTATFIKTVFTSDALFSSAVFTENASFHYAAFNSVASFAFATFSQPVKIESAKFAGDAWFRSAAFNDFTYFLEAQFGAAEGSHGVSFADAQFLKPANFRGAIFHSKYPDFSGAVLHEKTMFTDKDDNWPKCPQADPEQAKASCAVIRHNLGKQGLPEQEHFFYRREMGFATQIGGLGQRLPYFLFKWFSGYGYSIALPLIWLGVLWAFGVAAFAGYFIQQSIEAALGKAMGLSFSDLFPVFGFGRLYFDAEFMKPLPAVLKVVASGQTVLALPLLFFLGLGLRNRFRLR